MTSFPNLIYVGTGIVPLNFKCAEICTFTNPTGNMSYAVKLRLAEGGAEIELLRANLLKDCVGYMRLSNELVDARKFGDKTAIDDLTFEMTKYCGVLADGIDDEHVERMEKKEELRAGKKAKAMN